MADVTGDESGAWRLLGKRGVYESAEVSLSEVDVELPTRERLWLSVARLPTSVAVALLDADDRVLLVRRYRFIRERWGWELPGGLVDEDETPAEAAVRELEELTGYRSGPLEHLIVYLPVAEIVDCEHIVFVAGEPTVVGEPVGLGAGERAEWMPLASVPRLIADGDVWNGTSVIGLLSLLAGRLRPDDRPAG